MAKGEKKNFVLAALKFWNLEKIFGLHAEKSQYVSDTQNFLKERIPCHYPYL